MITGSEVAVKYPFSPICRIPAYFKLIHRFNIYRPILYAPKILGFMDDFGEIVDLRTGAHPRQVWDAWCLTFAEMIYFWENHHEKV